MVVIQDDGGADRHRRASEVIADRLRERIRSGDLKVGDRLPTQAQLAAEFGVERGVVRQALRSLQDAELLVDVGRGSPPRVAEPAPDTAQPQKAMVALAPRLNAAFAAPDVRIDAVCLTAETLMLAVADPVRLIHLGEIRPESLTVRILLPSRRISLAFPAPIEMGTTDERVHLRWLGQRNAQGKVLRHNLQSLHTSHGIDVDIAFRALPFTPPIKLYLLGGEEALFAYYTVTKRAEESDEGRLDMYDALGRQSLLFSFRKRAGGREAAFVTESQNWFDALWETIATDLTLS
ncbi:FadR/GntR family transcriptional regulator [Streptomyces sp. TS71-3]|uniref:FadR/GntR family transcriptional regulator n=1 Tax=Streptomyces sp. TS71-3 TaxID=2733862 RepID=UPI001BB4377D|nr:GntR family transcriptional regulator [Streptomyces sp. TS71-3]